MSKSPSAVAIAAHPDDIEFCMAGTLLLLKHAGWSIHYHHIATGNCGSARESATRTRRTRAAEAQAAAALLGCEYHPPFLDDLEILYSDQSIRRLASLIRRIRPSIILTHSPQDYMEDHMTTSRLTVTAAFARGMPNYRTRPPRPAIQTPVTIYHALPYGLRDGLRRRIVPGAFVDTSAVHAAKRAALACHRSQKEWLDVSQGMDSYLLAMDEMSREVGRISGCFQHAEGWRRHSHLGFSAADEDPLPTILGKRYQINPRYEAELER